MNLGFIQKLFSYKHLKKTRWKTSQRLFG